MASCLWHKIPFPFLISKSLRVLAHLLLITKIGSCFCWFLLLWVSTCCFFFFNCFSANVVLLSSFRSDLSSEASWPSLGISFDNCFFRCAPANTLCIRVCVYFSAPRNGFHLFLRLSMLEFRLRGSKDPVCLAQCCILSSQESAHAG